MSGCAANFTPPIWRNIYYERDTNYMPGALRSGAQQDLATEVTEITEVGGLFFLCSVPSVRCGGSIWILVCRAYSFSTSFYIVGWTVRRDALCYVERRADTELYENLKQGQFCYTLTARQMGKTSLMVRTAARRREEGVGVAALDLTAIGQNLSAEQWYGGLLTQLGQQLDLEEELLEFRRTHAEPGPLQRWMQAIRQILLPRYVGQVVVFVDEIDMEFRTR